MRQALLCFLKYPQAGKVKTRLAADLGEAAAAELYRSLAERVITEAWPLESGYDLIPCCDPEQPLELYRSWLGDELPLCQQQGPELGKRLIHAFARHFEQGYERVIAIGSDCIGMDETFCNAAFRALAEADLVLGPAHDGGYYLIGLNRPQDLLFERMPWSTPEVLAITRARAEALGLRLQLLEEKLDLDTLEDLTRLRESLPEHHFIARKMDQLILDRLSVDPEGNE
jgi:rSAM/selenodomain-associated transferase 1